MGKPTGFLESGRELPVRRPVPVRLRDWREVYEPFAKNRLQTQASRCMDCGIPFCNDGCPLGNLIPDWNDLVYRDHWQAAIERLHATNNFPEFTGRLCPAPCESACVLGINSDPVTIKQVEVSIIDRAWDEGWVTPVMPDAADRATGRGHRVRPRRARRRPAAHPGRPLGDGLRARRPGRAACCATASPSSRWRSATSTADWRRWRRRARRSCAASPWVAESGAGRVAAAEVRAGHDAVVIAAGATVPRELPIPGRESGGHPPGHGVPSARQSGGGRRRPGRRPRRSSRPASGW